MINIKQKIIFPFYIMFWYCDFQASWEKLSWKMKNGLYFPNHDMLIRTLFCIFRFEIFI